MNGYSHDSLSFLSRVSCGPYACLSDSFETEAVLVIAQPTSKGHALSLERHNVALDSNVPADHLAQPGRYNGLAILLFGVEHPTHADGAVWSNPAISP